MPKFSQANFCNLIFTTFTCAMIASFMNSIIVVGKDCYVWLLPPWVIPYDVMICEIKYKHFKESRKIFVLPSLVW